MRRTFALVAIALASLAAAAVAALLRPIVKPVTQEPHPGNVRTGSLRMTTQLDRRYLPENSNGTAYLQVDLAADGDSGRRRRVPVNAVLILDRSGSMSGAPLAAAKEAAARFASFMTAQDRLSIVERQLQAMRLALDAV